VAGSTDEDEDDDDEDVEADEAELIVAIVVVVVEEGVMNAEGMCAATACWLVSSSGDRGDQYWVSTMQCTPRPSVLSHVQTVEHMTVMR
jgi:hypothetical protein